MNEHLQERTKVYQEALTRIIELEDTVAELLPLLEDYYRVFKDGGYFKPDAEFLKETQEAIRKAKGD